MQGTFFGVGVGPGDPELMTLKARRILGEVQVVFYPAGRGEDGGVALGVARDFLSPGQELVGLEMPMTRDMQALEGGWREAAEKVLAEMNLGKDAAFITLGDPSLYSTFGYLLRWIRRLDPNVKIETVPGVPSFVAAAARLNYTLVEGSEPLAVVPLPREKNDLWRLLRDWPNLVFLKVGERSRDVLEAMQQAGRPVRGAYVARCGWPDEVVMEDLAGATGLSDYLALVLVGEVRE